MRIGREIGYPVIIKAAGGGGGRGMRVVHNETALINSINLSLSQKPALRLATIRFTWRSSSRSHGISSFRLSLTRHGNAMCISFERDCSMQRRHQKVIEEAPGAGHTTEEQRDDHGRPALCVNACLRRLATENAGTFEFLYEDGEFLLH